MDKVIRLFNENRVSVRCLSPEDLTDSKKAVQRPQDRADIEFLEIKAGSKKT